MLEGAGDRWITPVLPELETGFFFFFFYRKGTRRGAQLEETRTLKDQRRRSKNGGKTKDQKGDGKTTKEKQLRRVRKGEKEREDSGGRREGQRDKESKTRKQKPENTKTC